MESRPPKIRAEWAEALEPAFERLRASGLREHLLARRRDGAEIFPPSNETFAALDAVAPRGVRVVLLGQDPYHGGQAHGMAFSVRRGVAVPPSLVNIHKELAADVGVAIPRHGNLEAWARQGVLLLNTLLSVERRTPLAHKGRGWEPFTDDVIRTVSDGEAPVVFMLWGAHAQKKAKLIDETRHLVIRGVHPSPLSAHAGWFGSKPFSRANDFLEAHGRGAVDWSLDPD